MIKVEGAPHHAWEYVACTFGLGGLLGLIELVAAPSGWWWTATRALVFALFVAALVLWLAALVKDRRFRHPRAS
jgi:hypothetical protein